MCILLRWNKLKSERLRNGSLGVLHVLYLSFGIEQGHVARWLLQHNLDQPLQFTTSSDVEPHKNTYFTYTHQISVNSM